jgi:hypothetical protein
MCVFNCVWYFLVFVGLVDLLEVNGETYPSMSCGWTGYNNWDSSQKVNLQSDFLAGQYSYHDNGKEDRKYKWKYCKASGESSMQKGSDIVLTGTWYNWSWRRGCGGNTALNYVYSNHDNVKEDRRFGFKCSQINNKYKLDECTWTTNWVNNWDSVLNFECNNNGLVRTVESYHDNGKQDRRWKFECCRLALSDFSDDEITDMDCTEPNYYENDWDGSLNISPTTYFLNGINSYHNNDKEDRLFRFRRCRPNESDDTSTAFSDTVTLDTTSYDAKWTKSCSGYNNGNSAMVGLESWHSNSKEDRQFKFTCGHLDSSRYGLANCGWTGDIGNYDSSNNFDCPGNGVIRSVWSYHRNDKEDRLFRFECCTVVPGKFSESIGKWSDVISCRGDGCGIEHSVTIGTTTSKTSTTTEKYRNEFTQSLSLGYTYEYAGESGSIDYTVTSTQAKTTSYSLESTVEQSVFTTQKVKCEKTYLYQWRQEAYDYTNTQDITMYSLDFLCTDNQFPACPLGWCDNDDCDVCRDGFSN